MLRSRSAPRIVRSARFSFLTVVACSLVGVSASAKPQRQTTGTPADKTGLKDIPLTVGHEAKGLVLPNYDRQGKLLGRFEAETANRLDENHVRFTHLLMTTFDAQEKPDYHVNMPNAVLNLETRVIVSDQRTTVKRVDFEIAGDAMRFSTLTHQGTLTGHVHMTIYNQSELAGKKSAK
jgi:lipopolysaccharide export system protein LptC